MISGKRKKKEKRNQGQVGESCILWSDQIKLELFDYRDAAFGEKGDAQNPKNTVPTVKRGGGSFMSTTTTTTTACCYQAKEG